MPKLLAFLLLIAASLACSDVPTPSPAPTVPYPIERQFPPGFVPSTPRPAPLEVLTPTPPTPTPTPKAEFIRDVNTPRPTPTRPPPDTPIHTPTPTPVPVAPPTPEGLRAGPCTESRPVPGEHYSGDPDYNCVKLTWEPVTHVPGRPEVSYILQEGEWMVPYEGKGFV